MLLFDAQTSGGLLLALKRAKLDDFLERADKEGVDAWPIGEVEEGEGIEVHDSSYLEQRHEDVELWFWMPES